MTSKEERGEMPEENTGGDPQNTPEGEMLEGTDAGNKPDAATLQAQLEETRKALKAANNEAADRRKKLQAFEEAEAKRKEAEMTEVEKLQAQLAEMAARDEATQQSLRETKLNGAIDLAAGALKFRKATEARALINRDALEYGDDGEWSGVEKALKALAKDSPHLIEQVVTADTDGTRRNTADPTKASEAKEAQIKQRYGFQM